MTTRAQPERPKPLPDLPPQAQMPARTPAADGAVGGQAQQ